MYSEKAIRLIKWVNKRYPLEDGYANDKAAHILSLLCLREDKEVFDRLARWGD